MNRAATKTTPTATFWPMRTPTASASAGAHRKFQLRVTPDPDQISAYHLVI